MLGVVVEHQITKIQSHPLFLGPVEQIVCAIQSAQPTWEIRAREEQWQRVRDFDNGPFGKIACDKDPASFFGANKSDTRYP